MEQIEKVEVLTKKQKMFLRLKNFLKIKTVAYTVSAAAGMGAGNATQNIERDITGYDPVVHQAAIEKSKEIATNDYENFKKENEAKEKKGTLEWAKDIFEKAKQGILNPKEFIKNTEMYRAMYLKYLSTLKFIDDAAFIVPALLMFIMLGGFLSRKMKEVGGDVVDKTEKELLRAKINELVEHANDMRGVVKELDATGLSLKELEDIRNFLRDGAKALPDPDTLE